MTITKAMILAAGFGKRLRPHTLEIPKPMVKIWGQPMMDHAIEKLNNAGIKDVVVNTHYKAEIIHDHLKNTKSPRIHLSHEDPILETGGGIKNAMRNVLPALKDEAFLVISGNSIWEDAPHIETLSDIQNLWNPEIMDILISLQPIETMTLTKGVGDYTIGQDSRAIRSLEQSGTHMFNSIRINAPHIFDDTPNGAFSYLDLLDRAQAKGRLYAHIHKGIWHHISTPEDLTKVNTARGIK